MRKVVIIDISLEKAINQNRSHKVICISVIVATKIMVTIVMGGREGVRELQYKLL